MSVCQQREEIECVVLDKKQRLQIRGLYYVDGCWLGCSLGCSLGCVLGCIDGSDDGWL